MNTQVRRPNIEQLYREADDYTPATATHRPPLIGISANRKDGLSCLAETYIQSVLDAEGTPVLIPVMTDIAALTAIVSTLDGLIMTGGGDINPLYLGEEPVPQLQDVDPFRDEYDLLLIRLASNRQIPLMGICRGHQLINVAFGGSIYQDIQTQHVQPCIKHSQSMAREQASHTIRLEPVQSLLRMIWQDKRALVNSFHHQAIKEVAPGFIATATAPDGINEAMEHPEKSIFSVQWHPEAMAPQGDPFMQALFRLQVTAADLFRQAKEIHANILTLDSHTDTPMLFPRFDLGKKEGGKVNLPLMEEGRIDAAFMVAYIPQGERDDASLKAATAYAVERLTEVKRQEKLHPNRMGIAYTAHDPVLLKGEGKKAIFLGIENGYALGKDIGNLAMFKQMGVSYITLCHNGDNDLCDSTKGQNEWNGLSPFGKDVVREMNRLGMMIDVSHAAESTFYDVLKTSRYPVIASHSSARALCNHPRNLTDDQIVALAKQGGVVQVCLYKGFINPNPDKASLEGVVKHINHIVRLAGIDHVGIGSDFDGDGEVIGCRAANELINITVRLLKEGYGEEDLRKIWGGNLIRVMAAVQAADKTH